MAKQVFCCALLLLSILTFAATAHALKVVNQLRVEITVYAQPQCLPCNCGQIECIRAPCIQLCQCPLTTCQIDRTCPQSDCVCTRDCKYLPGNVVGAGLSVAVALDLKAYPLAYVAVEVGGKVYIVIAADRKRITVKAKLVVTGSECRGGLGIQAELYLGSSSKQPEHICLVLGERYGS